MLKQRLLTAALLLPLLLALLFYAPNAVWGGLLALFLAGGAFEWARLGGFSRRGHVVLTTAVFLSCVSLLALSLRWTPGQFNTLLLIPLCLIAAMFWVLVVPLVLRFRCRMPKPFVMAAVGWIVLVPTWLAATVLQREPVLLLSIFAAVWVADTAAYFTGRRFGKHKLAPSISPGKTIEGVVGAYVAVLVYAAIALRFYSADATGGAYLAVLTFGFVLTSLSVAGDLFESWTKRQAGTKDSGDLLPGHGGILDRIDSLTATLPFAVLFFAGLVLR